MSDDDSTLIYEMCRYGHRWYRRNENDINKPYVVTVERGNNAVLAIRRNWNIDDPFS